MNPVFWYLDAQRERRGPFESNDIIGFIRAGTIARDTLVWDSSLNAWHPAAELPELAVFFGGSVPLSGGGLAPPPLPLEGGPLAFAGPAALIAEIPVWGLFWRSLLRALGSVTVIPAPWTETVFYRFLCSCVALPNGTKLIFEGKAGDIWYIFILIGILGLAGQYHHAVLFTLPVASVLQTYVVRWFCAKLKAADGSLNIAFEGHLLGLAGWIVLFFLSVLTIIGWA
jgi:hypothetical protein